VTRRGALLAAALERAVNVRDEEVRALLWSFAYFFCLLTGYYILRPLREEMGVASGVENLQWLFTGTFVAMLLAVPAFGAVVARFPRRRFVPLVYRFFIVNLLIFFALLHFDLGRIHVARAFFIWVSLFNLFVVSVFWSFMADIFRTEQARRLFGFVAAGGSLGALLGPTLTASLAVPLGPVALLLVSAAFLEVAVQCIHRLLRATDGWCGPGPRATGHMESHPPILTLPSNGAGQYAAVLPAAPSLSTGEGWGGGEPAPLTTASEGHGQDAIGGGVLAGITQLARSPYLLGICLYILLFTTTSTFLYFQQAKIVAAAFDDPGERTRLFAVIDLLVALLTLAIQCFATGRLMPWLGVGVTLAFLPLFTMLGFLILSLAPTLAVLVAFQALRRATNYAVSRPAREVLFTVVPREQKYKAKNVIDTVVYRGGDMASGWAYTGLASGLGLGLPAIALLAVPLAGLWLALGLRLGRAQERRAAPAPA
jgi:AAA family ATP:ADP antiporter